MRKLIGVAQQSPAIEMLAHHIRSLIQKANMQQFDRMKAPGPAMLEVPTCGAGGFLMEIFVYDRVQLILDLGKRAI